MATPTLTETIRVHLDGRTLRKVLSAAGLILTLVFVFAVARIPHTQGAGYPLPLHMDEWLHMGKTAAVARQGTTSYANPWFGGQAPEIAGSFYHEVGFHVVVAQVQMVTGVDWVPLFTYGPGVVLAFTALGAYALAKPYGFGLEAALFTALIPTSVRFLGPAFLVPISFTFPWIIAGLLLAFHADEPRKAGPLVAVVTMTWLIHARAGAFLTVPVVAAGLLKLPSDRRTGLAVLAAAALPLLFAYPKFQDAATTEILLEQRLPIQRAFFDNFGLGTLVLFGLGGAFAASDVVKKRFGPAILTGAAMFAFLFIFSRAIWNVNIATMYSRAHMLFFVTAAPVAGYGLARILQAGADALPVEHTLPTARILAIVVLLLAVSPAVAHHQEEPYYHVIDEADHETFRWIDQNLDPKYDNALMYPWKGLVFSAVTGRNAATVQFPGDDVGDSNVAFRFFRTQDVQILRRNQIGVVYTPDGIDLDDPGLEEVHENVYILLPPPEGGT